jgi:nucleoside-diphosphate-sugar epimerase
MILLTGASGFVGSAMLARLQQLRLRTRLVQHKQDVVDNSKCSEVIIAPLTFDQNWTLALSDVTCIIHCAARVHVMHERAGDPISEFRRVNVDGTLNLARQASEAGVRRFVFISSIKVNGEDTDLDHPFTADQIPSPGDPYGVSKYEAEIGLIALAKKTGMEVVIIRPPLVYGPGVKANFLSMMSWLQKGFPLPLGGLTKNRRSLVFLDNLVDLLSKCINHPAAANQIFLVSDDEDLSTAGLLERMSLALGQPSRLMAVPPALIALGARLAYRDDIAQRLCSSLQVDIKKTKHLLGWSPPVSVDEGLRQTAAHFLKM